MQSLTEILSQIRAGAALHDAGKDLAEVVRAVLETGKAGKLTFTLVVEPDKTDETIVTIQPDCTMKLPRKARAKGIFFYDQKSKQLTRDDPRQLELLAEKEADRQAEQERQRAEGITHLSKVGRGNGTDG